MTFDASHPEVLDAVRRALAEDIGAGDITTELCVPADASAQGRFIAREPMTVAGVELLPVIFDSVPVGQAGSLRRVGNPPPAACEVHLCHKSGARLQAGDEIARVHGPARALLTAERTALNFLQRLSGVATLASAYARAVEGTGCRVLDTRKTTPGLRQLEKMAAAAGGVTNHRTGLFDAVLIKNNHIEAAGGVRAALERVREAPAGMKVEIEVRTRAELDEALACGAQHLLLDNLTPAEAREWIGYIAGRATVELSGGITLATARAYAEAGADFLSSGAITHSAPAVDINFRLELQQR
ncbi:MAG TPA: carboxylating nicotinate-nucleotide diphosphorylase [Bryobacteraceae bacterium]|nr:carboxylating nicotinate-nucleotide diphosphorylase [Bryobacteraceae bacterium]